MPHVTIEYTENIRQESTIPKLLKKINTALIKHADVIPIGGLRTRAICLHDYCVADGTDDDAFVHVILKLGKGRTEEQIERVADALFKVVQDHYKILSEKRYLALSLEIYEFTRPTRKQNNIHQRY